MRITIYSVQFALSIILLIGTTTPAQFINFEGLADSTLVTNQYPNIVFGNAIAVKSGITLNEFDFPPLSGTNVVMDDGGAVMINFTSPIKSFSGHFTYTSRLRLVAFNSANNIVATKTSAFNNNTAFSGILLSRPNEFLSVNSAGGISKIIITGVPSGSSFTLDDVLIQPFVNGGGSIFGKVNNESENEINSSVFNRTSERVSVPGSLDTTEKIFRFGQIEDYPFVNYKTH